MDGTAMRRQDIVLGLWLFALQEAGGDIPAVTTAPDSRTLATMLPKSLEMSALVEAWSP